MSYTALYREWRPLVFEDVVEQEHIVKTLKYSVTAGRIAHAYLFCGTRGTGKTTMAHILSRAINCLNPQNGDPCNECEVCKGILEGSILDVLEIDAASNNSVDNVREIRDEVIYAPSTARYKVYIIDEVHMLSTGAFNALLKTLEEPPSHVVFILATTEPHKLPATILSRCQRFDFRKISVEGIVQRLDKVAHANGITFEKEALRLISRLADGALRDALSIMDQCMSLGSTQVSYKDVLSVVGIVNDTFICDFVESISSRSTNRILQMIDELVMSGKDLAQFVSDLVYYYRNLLVCSIAGNPGEVIDAPADILEKMKQQAGTMTRDTLINSIKELSSLEANMKWAGHPRILLEVAVIKLCEDILTTGNDNIGDRLSALERRLENVTSVPIQPEVVKAAPEIPAHSAAAEPKPHDKEVREAETAKIAAKPCNYLALWDEVADELKKTDRMALFSNLSDTKAVELDNRHIAIVFGNNRGFNKMYVSRLENIETIQKILQKKLGHEVRLKCIDEEDLSENNTTSLSQDRDEFTEKAVSLAKKLNVPYDVIDK